LSDLKTINENTLQGLFTGNDEDSAWILSQLIKQEIPVSEFYIKKDSVEDLFFNIGANDIS